MAGYCGSNTPRRSPPAGGPPSAARWGTLSSSTTRSPGGWVRSCPPPRREPGAHGGLTGTPLLGSGYPADPPETPPRQPPPDQGEHPATDHERHHGHLARQRRGQVDVLVAGDGRAGEGGLVSRGAEEQVGGARPG